MKLSVHERMLIGQLLPTEGNIITHRVVNELKTALFLSEEENQQVTMTQTGDQLHWDATKDPMKDVPVSEAALGIVCKALKEMEEAEKLPATHVSLFEKFVERKQE